MITMNSRGWDLQVAQIARASKTKPKPTSSNKMAQSEHRKRLGSMIAARHAWDAAMRIERPSQDVLDEWWTLALKRFAVLRPERGRRASEWMLASQDKQGRALKVIVARLAAEDLGLIPAHKLPGEK